MFGINCVLTGVFLVMLAGMIYMKSVNASMGSGGCPPGEVPNCPWPDGGYTVYFPHPTACDWFFHCVDGVAFCHKCLADLIWNHWWDSCDFAVNVGYTEEQANACRAGGSGSGNHCPDPYDVPHRFIEVTGTQTVTTMSDSNGNIQIGSTIKGGFARNSQVTVTVVTKNCNGQQQYACCKQSDVGVTLL